MQLYLWGALFNTVAWLLALAYAGQPLDTIHPEGRMDGWTWAVIACNALTGLAISAVLKFADNIARVYAHAAAMLATALLCMPLFGVAPTPQLLIAMVLVSTSGLQYQTHPYVPPDGEPEPAAPLLEDTADTETVTATSRV